MKKTLQLISSFLLLIFSVPSFSMQEECPSFNEISALTKNGFGNSSYEEPLLLSYFKFLADHTQFKLDQPILDVGAGYGEASYALIKLGAKNIYINDLDNRNLACLYKNIQRIHAKNNKVTYRAMI